MKIEYQEDREQGNHDVQIDDEIDDIDRTGRYNGSETTELDIDEALEQLDQARDGAEDNS
jgi:hypothetical protein